MRGFGMKNNPPPKKCFCGALLSKPKNGMPASFSANYKSRKKLGDSKVWYITCDKCGTDFIWSWPNVWLERNGLPLFDTRREIK